MKELLVLIFLISSGHCVRRQNLGGTWAVTSANSEIKAEATVPGGIYTDLMKAGIIGDIYAQYGDINSSWVGETDWTFTTDFTIDDSTVNYENINLIFEGLDTFARVSINRKVIGKSDNMFIRYIFDVKDALQAGSNTIEVKFASPVKNAAALAEEQNKNYTIPMACPPDEYEGVCNVNQIRKMQASFSWDWGPSYPSSGIWKEVYLESFNTVTIRNVLATPIKGDNTWNVEVTVYFGVGQGDFTGGNLNISVAGIMQQLKVDPLVDEIDGEAYMTTTLEVPENEVEKWWPNGYGNQKLYELAVTYTTDKEIDDESVINDEFKLFIGFRTIELIQDEIEKGLTFYFKVNDVPIYAKGANEIPIDILPEKGQDLATIRKVLENARDVNMNMIRVWGGGIYESDYFYSLADEFGILIWQDFMFACTMYPTRPDYLKSVTAEVNYQTKRLGSHPSIAIWAGNNENEGLLAGHIGHDGWPDQIKQDYIQLYIDTIKVELKRILTTAAFVTSSPTNGLQSDAEGYVAEHPGDSNFGDIHYYNYKADSWYFRTFSAPRFASEFGYQSMPDFDAWKTVTNNTGDLHPQADFMNNRQHHPDGNNQNIKLIENQMTLPDPSSDNYIRSYVYYSQILQAQSVKTETEHYRSFAGRLDNNNNGYNMGALFWQLNDVWVGPTWSGVDYLGKWKMLQYFAKRFFAPIIVTGKANEFDEIEIYAVAEMLDETVKSANLSIMLHVFRWDSLEHQLALSFPFELQEGKSVEAVRVDIPNLLFLGNCGNYTQGVKDCFLHFHLMDEEMNQYAPENYYFLEKLKNSNLENPIVKIASVESVDDKVYSITVNTNMPALFVWLDMHEISGRFSDNGFMQISANQTVQFVADEATTLEKVIDTLTVLHLRDPSVL